MTNKELRGIFHANNIKISKEAVSLVQDHLRREVNTMAERVRGGNYKMLTADTMWVALGDWGFKSGARTLTKD